MNSDSVTSSVASRDLQLALPSGMKSMGVFLFIYVQLVRSFIGFKSKLSSTHPVGFESATITSNEPFSNCGFNHILV
jgi:hypothetical protein